MLQLKRCFRACLQGQAMRSEMRSRTETVLGKPKKASACCCQAMHGMQHVIYRDSIVAERTCHPGEMQI